MLAARHGACLVVVSSSTWGVDGEKMHSDWTQTRQRNQIVATTPRRTQGSSLIPNSAEWG